MAAKEKRIQELEQLKTMSAEETATFWETHDPADYWELLPKVEKVGTPKSVIHTDKEDKKASE